MATNSADSSSVDTRQPQRGRTMADEEVERIEQKRLWGDALDPIALNDPLGQSVERVIMRVGVTVVAILIAGILLAQVACKNIQLAAVPDLSGGVTPEVVDNALSHGITWAGEIMRFGSVELDSVENGTVTVTETSTNERAIEAVVSNAIAQSSALAMNAFRDPAIDQVVYKVSTHISEEDGSFATSSSAPVGEAFRVVWTRDELDGSQMSMRLEGAGLPGVLESEQSKIDETPGVELGA